MKKIALVALALMAIGFFLMLIGFMIGITPLYVDSTGMHRRMLQPELEEFTTTYDKSATVRLAFASEDVSIVRSDRFGYTVTGTYTQKLIGELSPSHLTLTQENEHSWFDFGWDGLVMFGRGSWRGAQITIYIPEDMTVEFLDANIASGDIRIDAITVGSLALNGASGDITMTNVKANDTEINVMSGNIRLNSIEVDSMRFSGASGDVTATDMVVNRSLTSQLMSGNIRISGDLRGEIAFSGASGDLLIEIDGASENYDWTINGISSDVRVFDSRGELPSSTRRNGQTLSSLANTITIDAVSGNITLQFLR